MARFVTAARDGDPSGLEKLLAADVTWWSDGGGKGTAALRPIEGREKVLRFLAGGARSRPPRTSRQPRSTARRGRPSGRAGDTLVAVVSVELRDGLIADLRAGVNPDKLECVRGRLARA
ncbi:hypothetical protein ACFV7R_33875 [Streptomyces sp. NPDC059866]|uniref:hypothetical protein n=1 Tax=Streptomyces sp. NPDC059866 TaxID=3346978 RepID=UPI00364DF5DE